MAVQLGPEQLAQMVSAMSIPQKQQALTMLKTATSSGQTLTLPQQQLLAYLESQTQNGTFTPPDIQRRPSINALTDDKISEMVETMTPMQRQQGLAMLKAAIANGQQLTAQQSQLYKQLELKYAEPAQVTTCISSTNL